MQRLQDEYHHEQDHSRILPDAAEANDHEGRDGQMVIIDPALGRKGTEGIVQQVPRSEKKLEPVILDKLTEDKFPRMLHPWPLSDKYFLVTSKPEPNSLWGLYLVDVFDNMTLIIEQEGLAFYEPIPLQKRERPPVIVDRVDLARSRVYGTEMDSRGDWVNVAIWFVFGYLVLNTAANFGSSSKVERYVMGTATALAAVCTLIVALA